MFWCYFGGGRAGHLRAQRHGPGLSKGVGGRKPTSELGGVKVGTVTSLDLNPRNLSRPRPPSPSRTRSSCPTDTAVIIASEGLLGGTFVELLPGGSPFNIEPGGEIIDTQSSDQPRAASPALRHRRRGMRLAAMIALFAGRERPWRRGRSRRSTPSSDPNGFVEEIEPNPERSRLAARRAGRRGAAGAGPRWAQGRSCAGSTRSRATCRKWSWHPARSAEFGRIEVRLGDCRYPANKTPRARPTPGSKSARPGRDEDDFAGWHARFQPPRSRPSIIRATTSG